MKAWVVSYANKYWVVMEKFTAITYNKDGLQRLSSLTNGDTIQFLNYDVQSGQFASEWYINGNNINKILNTYEAKRKLVNGQIYYVMKDGSVESRLYAAKPVSKETLVIPDFCNIWNVQMENCRSVKFGRYTYILNTCFIDNKELESVEFNECLSFINNYAFKGCSGIKELTFPQHLVSIGRGAFENCKGLEKLTFKFNTEFDKSTFVGCMNVKSVVIDTSIFFGMDGLLEALTNLETIYFTHKLDGYYRKRVIDDVRKFNSKKIDKVSIKVLGNN